MWNPRQSDGRFVGVVEVRSCGGHVGGENLGVMTVAGVLVCKYHEFCT